MYETLIIDGVDIAGVVTCITSLDGFYNIATTRGDNVTFPGVDGETWVPKPYQVGTIELGLTLSGSNAAGFNSQLRTLRRLVTPGKRVTVVRRLGFTSGNEEHTAQCEYASGLNPSLTFARYGRTTLGLKVLSGLWYSSATYTISPGTVSVEGDTRTHRMTITMAAGTLTNSTTGHSVTYSGPGTATIDVESMTATTGGVDVSGQMTWTGTYPFQLAPGTNSISGSASITYNAAYL